MNEEREKVYQILELGKHIKNLHHKKGFGGLLFIDLSMIKFSKLSSYIRQLDKENQELNDKINKAIDFYETYKQECVIGRTKDEKLIKKIIQENQK